MTLNTRYQLGVLSFYLIVSSPALAADRDPKIQRAIDRGVALLKSYHDKNGVYIYSADMQGSGSNVGATALVGLTLLECGVPPDDPVIQQAAQFVRKNSPSLVYTYGLSASIWFLDRLGDESDVYLIQSMAVRLLAGQNDAGGWSYQCPNLGGFRQEEVRRLMNLNPQAKEKKEGEKGRRGDAEKEGGQEKDKKAPERPPVRELPPDIQDQLKKLAQPPAAQPQQPDLAGGGPNAAFFSAQQLKGDNSNTQFAALGLWVARRYAIPVQPALTRIEKRFRATQLIDGAWDYMPGYRGINNTRSPAMSCAGLIGLAVGHGAAVEAPKDKRVKVIDPDKDNNMQAGFHHLGDILQEFAPVRVIGGKNDGSFYFLWSLERVAEIYGLKTIGRRDWYAWGSNVLLGSQQDDGGWYGKFYPSGVDTCFALLFLVRANVAKDLSVTLRGKMRDPGTRTLKAGGVGADALKKQESGVKGQESEVGAPSFNPEPAATAKKPETETDLKNKETQEARRMSDELASAPDAQQADLLSKYKEGKGTEYTLALAGAIPRLKGETKSKAREALAERLTRMTADTLRGELKDDDPEIRRAASLACAMKDDKTHVPDLIPLLDDPEPLVGRAAHAALKSLTGQDLGPAKDASAKERINVMEAWKGWWSKQQEKQ